MRKIDDYIKSLDQVDFDDLNEPVKCNSLYSQKELLRALHEGASELIGLMNVDGRPMFHVDNSVSNVFILCGLVALIAGLSCFFLPFATTPVYTTMMLVVVYMVCTSVMAFIEGFMAPDVVAVIRPKGVANAKSIMVLGSFEGASKSFKLGIAPFTSRRDFIFRGVSKMRTNMSNYRPSNLWESCRKTWARTKSQNMKSCLANMSSTFAIAYGLLLSFAARALHVSVESSDTFKDIQMTSADEAKWVWVPTPSRQSEEILQNRNQSQKQGKGNQNHNQKTGQGKGGKSKEGEMAQTEKYEEGTLYLQHHVTRYFDTNGMLVTDNLSKDLTILIKKYFAKTMN